MLCQEPYFSKILHSFASRQQTEFKQDKLFPNYMPRRSAHLALGPEKKKI
jgi:hypothetical protein